MNFESKKKTVCPVILPVSPDGRMLTGRERVAYLSAHARRALEISAEKSGFKITSFLKDKSGIPQPTDGIYWSITHKPEYVAGVTARRKIGIDIEKIRTVSEGLFNKTASEPEWRLTDADDRLLRFFRYWTSKEAVIKAAGTGLKDLLKCRIVEVDDDLKLVIRYMDRDWTIEHFYFNQHIASVVRDSLNVRWCLVQ